MSMKDTKVRIQPLGDRIVVKEFSADETSKKTASGIFIPDTIKEDKGSKQGKVVAVGSGRYVDGTLIPLEPKVGDTVLFQWGDKINLDGQEYYIVADNSVMAIIK